MIEFVNEIKSAELGKTHLFSVGQAGFIIKSASGELLGIDMYLSDCVERVEGHVGYKRLLPKILNSDELIFNCIIATHFHRDHFDIDSMKELLKSDKTRLFAAEDCKDDVGDLCINKNQVAFVKPGDEYYCGSFKFNFINCDHGTGAPKAIGIIVTVDSKKILETGDTCLRLDRVSEYRSVGDIGVLIAPINGAYGNLNETECAQLSNVLNPKITIPCHYGMFASHGGNPGKFYQIMTEQYPDNAFLLMTQGEKYTF